MLPWEDHARKGYFFFSWKGGFVCTGPEPKIPEGWLDDVLKRSRFNFTNEGNIWATEGLNINSVAEDEMSGGGSTTLPYLCYLQIYPQ